MSKVALTYRDYTALPDDGKRYELYDGELVEVTSPTLRHQRAVRQLVGILDRHVRADNLREVIPARKVGLHGIRASSAPFRSLGQRSRSEDEGVPVREARGTAPA